MANKNPCRIVTGVYMGFICCYHIQYCCYVLFSASMLKFHFILQSYTFNCNDVYILIDMD